MAIGFMAPALDAMAAPSFAGPTTLGERGDNLSSALDRLLSRPGLKDELSLWLSRLTPMDVTSIEIGRLDPFVLAYIIDGKDYRVSLHSASEGTLRFLLILAMLLDSTGSTAPFRRTVFLEEIETGLHPTRLNLLVELIESKTLEDPHLQIIATTHSPLLLKLLSRSSIKDALLTYRHERTSQGQVRLLMDIESAPEVAAEFGLDDLLKTGWFENAAHFTEPDEVVK